ncbi:MAG: protease SohB [Gammaproteobacteria bacterium]|nr:protease SohB [Gammaproteobacteria bacterium]
MIDLLMQYALFLAQVATLVVGIGVVVAIIAAAARRDKEEERLEIDNLNTRLKQTELKVKQELMDKKAYKGLAKSVKKAAKKKVSPKETRLFVVNFRGDIRATAVNSLREEISAILTAANKGDEVLVRLENAGGLVHDHGLAASQLARVRSRGLRLTVAVDKIAASGGYLMACVADRILAAPFAVLGSIGVLAQIPNFNRLLDSHGIDFEQFKGGEYKRTVTLFGKNTDADRNKFREEIVDTHTLFKEFVAEHRPALDIDNVATGEHWYGKRALELKLCDELKTSDDYLLERSDDADIYEIRYSRRKPLGQKLSSVMECGVRDVLEGVRQRVYERRFAA